MRKIRFRIWDGTTYFYPEANRKASNHYLQFGSEGFWLYNSDGKLVASTTEEDICEQFTGLKDKNGKDIYEGDIVQYKYYYARKRWWSDTKEIPIIAKEVQDQRDDFNTEKVKVEFKDGCFVLGYSVNFQDVSRGEKTRTGSTHNGDFEEKYCDFEVIGNIHENPAQ